MFLSNPLVSALDVVSLTMTVVNAGSAGGDELADQLEDVLRAFPHLQVERHDSTVVARTELGHGERVVLVGRIDLDASSAEEGTDGEADELLARVEMGKLYGAGACDALGGVAVMLKMAALGSYARDVTLVFGGPTDGLTSAPEVIDATVTVRMRPTGARLQVDGSTAAPQEPGWGELTRLIFHGAAELSYGPGDPAVAHTPGEFVPTAQLAECEHVVKGWVQT